MSTRTSIEWTEVTWNPVRGCSKVSEGCRNCYAMRQAHRFSGPGGPYEGLTKLTEHGPEWTGKIRLVPELLAEPLRWRKPRRVFVDSMSDWLHEDIPDEYVFKMLDVMTREATWHSYQVLTKRADRLPDIMQRYVYSRRIERNTDWWLRNLWLGVSVEDQKTADTRIPLLLQTPAAVHWISAEPLLGPLDLRLYFEGTTDGPSVRSKDATPAICWVVVGGESGPGARPMHPDWVCSIRDQCQSAGVPFFFKQWGAYMPVEYSFDRFTDQDGKHYESTDLHQGMYVKLGKKNSGRLLDGREWNEYPSC